MKTAKTLASFTLVLFLAFGFYSCKNTSLESKQADDIKEMVTKAFEAEFIGDYRYIGPDTIPPLKCTDSLNFRVIVDCQGTSNIMGAIKVHFDFCSNEQGDYGNLYGYFVDESKDTLFISGDFGGKVIQGKTEEHPAFVTSYWKDEFTFTGGSGKYKDATGKGMTDDYNSSEDPNSHHNWKGTITLPKEKE